MYQLISDLSTYFVSIRLIKNNVCLDVKLPINWEINKEFLLKYPTITGKIQDQNNETILYSFVTLNNENDFNNMVSCCKEIITHNLETEQKNKLLEEKISQLKELFNKESLDNLKNIDFK